MSFLLCGFPVVECVYCLACARWAWKRCLRTAGHDSEDWNVASTEEFDPVPRLCRIILANYENDLENPLWSPPGGYGIDPQFVIRRKHYKDTGGRCTPYLIYLDHAHNDIVLALRGLNLAKESDYALMLDNRLGKTSYDGGFVHNGLLRAAAWVLDAESEVLSEMVVKYPSYTLSFAGHSLGSGVAAMLAMLVVQNREGLGNVARERVRCFAIAPARCMSLNLAVKYADVINSVILQDDFLPRTATPLEDIFKSIFCLPCILCLRCMRDTFIPEEKMFRDPRRLYAPGRLYHIVERKPFRCKRFPPEVRTAVPVDGRFEHIVLSCNATSDHAIIWVEREAQRALDLMLKKERTMEVPPQQKMQRQATLSAEHNNEHKAALQRAVTLAVPDAYTPSYGTFDESSGGGDQESTVPKKSRQETWHHLINRLFEKEKYGDTNLKKTDTSSESE